MHFALTFRHLVYLRKFPKRFNVVCLCPSGHPLFYSQKSGKSCFATGAMWGLSYLPLHHQISRWLKALCGKACTFISHQAQVGPYGEIEAFSWRDTFGFTPFPALFEGTLIRAMSGDIFDLKVCFAIHYPYLTNSFSVFLLG